MEEGSVNSGPASSPADPGAAAAPVSAREKVTANVLTGFLGSGKTSLLKRLLASEAMARTAVLINEFGEVGIDHLLVEALDEDVVLLKSGCVCCSIRGDLKAAIVDLFERRRHGLLPPFDRIVIETTGLADPGPIVATFNADPVLRHHVRLGNIVTVVDAVDGMRNLEVHPEAVHQLAVADRVVVSKTDLAAPHVVAALRRSVARLNPTAEVVENGERSPIEPGLFTDDLHDAASRAREVGRWLSGVTAPGEVHGRGGAGPSGASGPEHHHHAHHGAQAFVITREAPLDWAAFGLWLSMLLNRHGRDILRVKGLLDVAGVEAPVVIHGVQHTIHKPEHLAAWPEGDRRTRLVFIVTGLDPARIERSFHAFNDR